jgi:hypothetical protein
MQRFGSPVRFLPEGLTYQQVLKDTYRDVSHRGQVLAGRSPFYHPAFLIWRTPRIHLSNDRQGENGAACVRWMLLRNGHVV